jgi:hypothetical protein
MLSCLVLSIPTSKSVGIPKKIPALHPTEKYLFILDAGAIINVMYYRESSFTLYLWSTKDIKMDELTNAKEISVQGEWKGKTAGGCLNHPFTWRNNPQFLMTVSQPIDLDFRLRQSEGAGGKFQSIGFYIVKGAGKRRLTVTKDDIVSKAGFATIRDSTCQI